MKTEKQKQGVLGSWSDRNFGIIICKSGSKIEKFFLHLTRVAICEPATPHIGCTVFFNISPKPPKHESDLPFAIDAEIYEDNSPLDGIKVLSGVEVAAETGDTIVSVEGGAR